MEQNNIWMRYLTLGLIISLLVQLTSCKDPTFQIISEVNLINETNYKVEFPLGYEKYNVTPKSKTAITEIGYGRGKGKNSIQSSNFASPFYSINNMDDFTIKFGQTKCLANIKINDDHSIRDIKNFVVEKIGENHFKFTYTFTEADYNRAVACP